MELVRRYPRFIVQLLMVAILIAFAWAATFQKLREALTDRHGSSAISSNLR